MAEKQEITIQIVSRLTEFPKTDAIRGTVLDISQKAGKECLTFAPIRDGRAVAIRLMVCLEKYILQTVWWKSGDITISDSYEDTPEAQKEALENIRSMLEEASAPIMPKSYIEVKVLSGRLIPQERIGIVSGAQAPDGAYKCYEAHVHLRYEKGRISGVTTVLTSDEDRILEIRRVVGGNSMPAVTLDPNSGKVTGFRSLYAMWVNESELNRQEVDRWGKGLIKTHKDSFSRIEDKPWHGGSLGVAPGKTIHYPPGYSSGITAKPIPALLRTAGDATGLLLFANQEKARKEGRTLDDIVPASEPLVAEPVASAAPQVGTCQCLRPGCPECDDGAMYYG